MDQQGNKQPTSEEIAESIMKSYDDLRSKYAHMKFGLDEFSSLNDKYIELRQQFIASISKDNEDKFKMIANKIDIIALRLQDMETYLKYTHSYVHDIHLKTFKAKPLNRKVKVSKKKKGKK